MTSQATSCWYLSNFENGRNCRLRRLQVKFLENCLNEDNIIFRLIGDNRSHKPARHDDAEHWRTTIEPLCNLRFADDIDLQGGSEIDLQQLERLEKTAASYGMDINSDKSNILVI